MVQWVLMMTLFWSTAAFATGVLNVDKSGLAIQGYDPVSYFKGGDPKRGDPAFQTKVGEAIYLFSNDANKQEFLKDPKKFEPQFGGWCAYAVADSKSKVEIDPKSFVIQDGRLLLFYKGLWGNTREKWLNTKSKNSKVFLQEADKNWPEVQLRGP